MLGTQTVSVYKCFLMTTVTVISPATWQELKCLHSVTRKSVPPGNEAFLILKIFPEPGKTYYLGCEGLETTWIWESEGLWVNPSY